MEDDLSEELQLRLEEDENEDEETDGGPSNKRQKTARGPGKMLQTALVNVLILEREHLVEIGTPRKQQQTN